MYENSNASQTCLSALKNPESLNHT